MTSSAFVDSASPGRNEVDSFFSASVNFAGEVRRERPATTASQISATSHLARRPAATAKSEPMRRVF